MTQTKLIAQLKGIVLAIVQGLIPVKPHDPEACEVGCHTWVEYRILDWTICAFNDGGDFDYIEWVQLPDGTRWDDDLPEDFWRYRPQHPEHWGFQP